MLTNSELNNYESFSGKYVKGDSTKPLHQCNFYGSVEAGNKLKEMLVLGASRPWKEAMEVMTGEPKMDTDAIREYFAPLELWLRAENKKNGVTVGWEHSDDEVMCKSPPTRGHPKIRAVTEEEVKCPKGQIYNQVQRKCVSKFFG